MTIKTEITFMVTRQNGAGNQTRRIMELSQLDFLACNRSDRNEKLKDWLMMQFPAA